MSVHVERTIEINAPPETIWKVMSDVENWPEWTRSMRRIEKMGDAPFGKGTNYRVAPRGAPRGVWTVTECEENRRFVWESSTANSHAVAGHVIEPDGAGSKVTLSVDVTGTWIVKVLGPLMALSIRRSVRQEAEGLKRRSEELAGTAPVG